MTEAPPREGGKAKMYHHFSEHIGESRCTRCSIRRNYMNECLAMLDKWPAEDKKTEEWQRKHDSLVYCGEPPA